MTIKTVRHYHQRGLLAEPPRDSSGYRRYSAQDAIDLVKIKTLAQAGVLLTRINELLAAEIRGQTAVGAGPGPHPAGQHAGRRVVAGLGPAHRTHQGSWRGRP